MQLFANNRRKRNTAFAALLVWLFALSSGVANACLLEAPAKHVHTHSHVAKARSDAAYAHVALAGAAEGSEHVSDVPKEACLKACDDGSKAPVKLQLRLHLPDSGVAALAAVAWDVASPGVSAPSQMDSLWPLIVGPPLRVRYSRLAL